MCHVSAIDGKLLGAPTTKQFVLPAVVCFPVDRRHGLFFIRTLVINIWKRNLLWVFPAEILEQTTFYSLTSRAQCRVLFLDSRDQNMRLKCKRIPDDELYNYAVELPLTSY